MVRQARECDENNRRKLIERNKERNRRILEKDLELAKPY